MRRPPPWWAALLGLVHVVAIGGAVAAQTPASAPSTPAVLLDRSAARVGEEVVATLTGWPGRSVTLSICGNQALRGSQDCNLVGSETESLQRDGSPSLAALPVAAPPMPCPCVVRASNRTNDIIAFAPLEVVGHPTGPLVEPAGFEPLRVAVDAERSSEGLLDRLRSALGGPTAYDVTVTVQNRSGSELDGVTVRGAVRRGTGDDDGAVDATDLTFPPVGALAGGERWTDTARVVLPAPALGRFTLTAVAAGAGPAATATDRVRPLPLLFFVVLVLFVTDVAAIAGRRLKRRQDARAAGVDVGEDDGPLDPDDRVPHGSSSPGATPLFT